MKPEQQRIKIAEWCGLPIDVCMCGDSKESFAHRSEHSFTPMCSQEEIPDFLNDLNAIHEVERKLHDETVQTYEAHLNAIIARGCRVCDFSLYASDKIWNATAAQRAEALLRTIGRWIDSPQERPK